MIKRNKKFSSKIIIYDYTKEIYEFKSRNAVEEQEVGTRSLNLWLLNARLI